MAAFVVTNTFVSGASITASGHNTNWSDVTTWLNNRYNGVDTWLNVKVSSTAANPVSVVSTAATTEVSIDNTAADGDPEVTFKLSGTQTHVVGVDDSDSDFLKFATTGLTTNVAFQIPTTGQQVQFAVGLATAPSVSFIGDADSGLYRAGANDVAIAVNGAIGFDVSPTATDFYVSGSIIAEINGSRFRPQTDNALELGSSTQGWQHIYASAGTVSLPAFTWTGDPDTGLYYVGANSFAAAAAGGTAMVWSNTIIDFYASNVLVAEMNGSRFRPQTDNSLELGSSTQGWSAIYASSGGVGTPSFTFASDLDTGLYRVGANKFATTTNGVARFTWDEVGNTIIGTAAIATNATDGFMYISSCAGTPTGTASSYAGRVPMVYDTSANKIWFYNGSWRGVLVA